MSTIRSPPRCTSSLNGKQTTHRHWWPLTAKHISVINVPCRNNLRPLVNEMINMASSAVPRSPYLVSCSSATAAAGFVCCSNPLERRTKKGVCHTARAALLQLGTRRAFIHPAAAPPSPSLHGSSSTNDCRATAVEPHHHHHRHEI